MSPYISTFWGEVGTSERSMNIVNSRRKNSQWAVRRYMLLNKLVLWKPDMEMKHWYVFLRSHKVLLLSDKTSCVKPFTTALRLCSWEEWQENMVQTFGTPWLTSHVFPWVMMSTGKGQLVDVVEVLADCSGHKSQSYDGPPYDFIVAWQNCSSTYWTASMLSRSRMGEFLVLWDGVWWHWQGRTQIKETLLVILGPKSC